MADQIQSSRIYRPKSTLPVSRDRKQKKHKRSAEQEHLPEGEDSRRQDDGEPRAQAETDEKAPPQERKHLLDESV